MPEPPSDVLLQFVPHDLLISAQAMPEYYHKAWSDLCEASSFSDHIRDIGLKPVADREGDMILVVNRVHPVVFSPETL